VEAKAGEVRMAEADGRKEKRGKGKKTRRNRKRKRKRLRKEKTIEVKRVAEEWKIWDKEEEAVKSEAEVRKLIPECFYKWI